MVFEIHSPTRDAAPRRALIFAVLLFACVSVLAAGMSWHRANHPLAQRVQPTGWPISFSPPRGWLPGLAPGPEPPTAITFHGVTTAGSPATAAFWWFKVRPDDQAKDVCYFVLDQHRAIPRPNEEPDDSKPVPTMLGRYEAHEAVDAHDRTYVRAVVLADGDAYAVSLSVDKTPIDDHLYRMFDLACQSIEFTDDE